MSGLKVKAGYSCCRLIGLCSTWQIEKYLLSFADDVTGLVNDLNHAPQFLARVNNFCTATGMRLNVDKTVIFPFRPWTSTDHDLQASLRGLGVRVLANQEHTTLLGIAVGPDLAPSLQLNQLLVRFQKLCVSWRWRARLRPSAYS